MEVKIVTIMKLARVKKVLVPKKHKANLKYNKKLMLLSLGVIWVLH